MPSYNKVILMGNLTRDPEQTTLPNGTTLVKFGFATNHSYTNARGEKIEEPMFIECAAFGKTAESIYQYCDKGKPLLIEGRLKLDQWKANGLEHSKHSIQVDRFSFVLAPNLGGAEREPQAQTETTEPEAKKYPDDDIPF